MRTESLVRPLSVAAVVGGLAATIFVCNVLVGRERAEARRQTEVETQHAAAQIQAGVLSRIEPLQRVGLWWVSQGPPVEQEDWNADAQLFLTGSAGLREVSWIDLAGVRRWSVAPGARPDIRRMPAPDPARPLIDTALRRHSSVLSGIVDLPGGRAGFYACVPIWSLDKLEGYVIGLYDASALLSSLPQTQLPDDYTVSVAANGRRLYSEAGPLPAGSIAVPQAPIRLFNQVWYASALLSAGHLFRFQALVLALGTLLTLLLYAGGVLLHLAHRRSAELQRANAALEREVKERKRIEATVGELNRDLHRKVADFQTLLDVIPIGIAVAEDPECRAIWVNPALARMMGVSRGLNISKTGPAAATLPYKLCRNGEEIPPDQLPMQMAAARAVELLGDEHDIVRADGQIVNLLAFVSPLFDEQGRVRGVLNAAVNITDRKAEERERAGILEREKAARLEAERALAALRASETRFQRLIESDVIGIEIIGPRRVLEANQFLLDMLGYSHEELVGEGICWPDLTPEEFQVNDRQRVQELLATGKLPAFEKEVIHKSGRRIPVLIGGTLLENPPEWKAMCFVLDLSLRRELEKRLQRAQKMKGLGVMAAGIAHDFSNLLTTILGNTELALDMLPPGYDAHRNISAALEAGHRAANLVQKVLAYTGNTYLSLTAIDVAGLLTGIEDALQRIARGKASIHLDVEAGLPKVTADADEIRQVITSLVVNAVEAIGPAYGRIDLCARACRLGTSEIEAMLVDEELRPGDYVRIDVNDTGCGMPPEVAGRAFDPFFTTKFLGRGLGLAAAQGIMRAHQGSIRVESSSPAGTRFQLFLPAESTEVTAEVPPLPSAVSSP